MEIKKVGILGVTGTMGRGIAQICAQAGYQVIASSRSEQRLAVFWLKLNEIRRIEEIYKVRPVLLLDDVFSELDVKNKKLIIDLVKKYQTVVTTTEIELLELADVPKSIIKL